MNNDPVDIHDEISKGFARIEKVMREESARISEIIREAVVQPNTYMWWDHDIPPAQVDCIKVKFEKVDKGECDD